MSPFLILARYKTLMMGRYFAQVRKESTLKVVVIFCFTTVFWYGLYWMLHRGFSFVQGELPAIAPLVTARVLALFFLTLFSLLAFSNVLVGYSTMYQSKEMDWLFNQPAPSESVFIVRFMESLGFSSWASLLLGMPLLIAYGVVFDVHWAFFLGIPVFLAPLLVISGSIGASATLFVVRLFPRVQLRYLIAVLVSAFVMLLVFLYRSYQVSEINQLEVVDRILAVLGRAQSPLYPSHWTNEGLLALSTGRWGDSLFFFGLLLSNALMALLVLERLAAVFYAPGWHGIKGWGLVRIYRDGGRVLGRIEPLLKPFQSATRALLMKDLRTFWRDPGQWLQVSILLGLLMVYVANLGNVDRYMDLRWQNRIAFLNLATTSLVLGVLTTRFIFPLFSLEGKRFWIVGLAPITRAHLVRQKFVLSLLTSVGFTEILMVISCRQLGVVPLVTAISCYTILCMNIALAGLAAGLGGVYPNFQEDNPARIVSGFGGTMNFLIAISYITAVVLIEGAVYFAFSAVAQDAVPPLSTQIRGVSFGVALSLAIGLVTVISAATAFIPLRMGMRNATALEF